MGKTLFTVSPSSLPKKKKAQDITAGAADISSSTPKIKVERVDKLSTSKPKSVIGKENTNNPITDKTLNMARAKGINKDQLLKMQHEADLEDLNREIGKYHKTKSKQLSKGNLDMGVEEVDNSSDKSEAQKQTLMKRYGVSEEEFDKKYNEYDEKIKTNNAQRKIKENEEYAKAHPVKGTLKSIGMNLISPAEGVANSVAAFQTGLDEAIGKDDTRHINADADFMISDSVNKAREAAKSNIKADTKLGKAALDKLYDVGVMAGDMAAQSLVSGIGGGSSLMGIMQGGNTANDMLKQSLENGNSQLQAGTEGLLGGALGYAMGTTGLDVISKNVMPKSLLGNIAKGALTEGGEELSESMIDEGINRAVSKIAGGNSNKDVAIKEYMANGMSEDEAKKAYRNDRLLENAVSFLGGAGFGGLFGAANGAGKTRTYTGKTNTAVLDMLNGKNTENVKNIGNIPTTTSSVDISGLHEPDAVTRAKQDAEIEQINNVLNSPVFQAGNVPSVNNSNIDISNLGKAPKNKVPNLNKKFGEQSYDAPTLDSSIKWGRNPKKTLSKLLADNTISIDEKERILNDYTQYGRTNRPITEEELQTVLSDDKITPEIKEQLINSINNGENIPKAIAEYLDNNSNVTTRNSANPYDSSVKYDDTYNVINEAMTKVPGRVAPGTEVDSKLGVYDNIANQGTEAPTNYNENLKELERVVKQINRQSSKTIKNAKDGIQNAPKATIKENFVNPSESNIEHNIRSVAQDGINKGLSVDEAMENAYNTVINQVNYDIASNPSKVNDLTEFHKAFNKVNNEYINSPEPETTTKIEEKIDRLKNAKFNEEMKERSYDGNKVSDYKKRIAELERQLAEAQGTKAPENFLNQNKETSYDSQKGDGNIETRSYVESVDLPDSFKSQLKDTVYRQLSNKGTVEKANKVLEEAGSIWEAKNKFEEMLNNQEAASVVLGYDLAKQFIDMGKQDVAVEIVDNIGSSLTRAGQFSQAAYITALRNDPIAVLSAMNKELKKINDDGYRKFKDNWNDITLTDEEISALNNAAGDTKAIQDITDKIYSRIAKDYPHTFWEYFYDTAKTFMLFNPRTHLRNVIANAVTMPVRSATDRVKAAMEIGYQLFDKNYKRTSSLIGGNKITDEIAGKIFDTKVVDILDNGGGKYEESKGLNRVQRESQLWKDNKVIGDYTKGGTEYLAEKTTDVLQALDRLTGGYLNKKTGIVDTMKDFKDNKITGSNMENLRQLNYLLLGDIEDTPFVKQNFINSLSNYLAAQKITDIDSVPQEAINLAYDEALRATFKDDNALTDALLAIKKKTGKIGDIAMPFTKTPANLAMRGIEYSPVGFYKSFKDFAKVKEASRGKVTNADISRFIGDLSKNVTGSAMILFGYGLAKAGFITGSYSEDKNEKNWQKLKGFQPNAFHIGDKYYTYDWAQPSSIPLLIGTAIYEGMQTQEKEEANQWEALATGAKSFGKGLINAGDAWFNLSPLQNVSNIMGGGDSATYGDNSIMTNLGKTVLEFPQALIPSALGATARATDTTIRNTYDKTSYGKTYLNQMQAKIPGLSKNLPASYDVWGRERKRGTDDEAAFSQFINPGTFGYYNDADNDIDNYVDDIYNAVKNNEEFKETQVLPRQAGYTVSIDGKDKTLNNKEYSLRQKTLGETQRGLVRAFSKVAEEAGLTKEEQAYALNKIYKAANDGTNTKLYGLDSALGSTEAEKYRKGAKEYATYVKDYMLAERVGLSYDQYMKKMGEGGEKLIQRYAKDKPVVDSINKELGTDMKVEMYETYKDRLPSATDDDVRAVETLKRDYDLSTNMNTLAALANMDVSDADRSHYLRMMTSDKDLDSGYMNRGREVLGDDYIYQILLYKAIATKYDGKDNTSLSNGEIADFVNDSFDTQEERDLWTYILKTPKKSKK